RCDFFKALRDSLGKQLLLAVKMPIKTSVRQIEFAHEVGDRDSVPTSPPEMLRRGANNTFACLLFLLGGISHINSDKMIYIIYHRHVNKLTGFRSGAEGRRPGSAAPGRRARRGRRGSQTYIDSATGGSSRC